MARRAAAGVLLAAVGVGSLLGCGDRSAGGAGATPTGGIYFQDMLAASGIDFRLRHAPGARLGIKETIGHGAALVDVDGDGLLDVLLTGPDRVALYRNLGGWRFQAVSGSGLRQPGHWQGVAVGDVNNDGRPDLFLSGCGCAALYLNTGGGHFRDVTAASGLVPRPGLWETSAAFADVDGDGRLDLYVACYVELGGKKGVCTYPGGVATACAPTQFPPQRGLLYRNLGGGRFQEVTAAWGLDGAHGNGLGAAFCDVNGDGYPDLYLANDQRPCDLFMNVGGRRFENRGTASGTALGANGGPQSGMGADWGDYDNDGRPDLVVANYFHEPRSLYHNEGGGLFANLTERSGLGPATQSTVSWGAKWADLDNDGLLDLALANGHPLHRIRELDASVDYQQRPQFFHNVGAGRLAEVTSPGPGLTSPLAGRALCAGDLDNDGRVDLLVGNIEGAPLLLRNQSPAASHWLTVRLAGKQGCEGAVVTLRAGSRQWVRQSTTGGSYLSASDARVHFGLGAVAQVEGVAVRWRTGATTVVHHPPVNRELKVEQ